MALDSPGGERSQISGRKFRATRAWLLGKPFHTWFVDTGL